jgi:hypothetical protein
MVVALKKRSVAPAGSAKKNGPQSERFARDIFLQELPGFLIRHPVRIIPDYGTAPNGDVSCAHIFGPRKNLTRCPPTTGMKGHSVQMPVSAQ